VKEVRSLLEDNPGLDVNWGDAESRRTALHWASMNGHADVVKLLLGLPAINVNVRSGYGATPFSLGCMEGKVLVVRLLLKDPRVEVALADNNGRTPLWWASCNGRHEVIEWLMASGRDLGDLDKMSKYRDDDREYSVLEIARMKNQTEVVSLLEKFLINSTQTRLEIRVKLGGLDELAAELFALIVFLCDGLLRLKPARAAATASRNSTAAIRFLNVARRLPMELQMMLCHRVGGSAKDSILSNSSEDAFKSLARMVLFSKSK